MSTFNTVTVDGHGMYQNKWVYLGNHFIDGSKTLRNLVWDM